jgi:hypothetical protein
MVKQLVLTEVNARDRKSAYAAFRDGWPPDHHGKILNNKELDRVLAAFVQKHPHLEDSLCSDQGIRLTYDDSVIATRVINLFTAAQIPVLCIHDSFIVPYDQVTRLKRTMATVSQAHLGQPLPVEASSLGLDEMAGQPDNIRRDFIAWKDRERCSGYLARLEEHRRGLSGTKSSFLWVRPVPTGWCYGV